MLSSDVEFITPGDSQNTTLTIDGKDISAVLKSVTPYQFLLNISRKDYSLTATWLRDLSDGFIGFDPDFRRRLPGPILVEESETVAFIASEADIKSESL